MAKNTADATDTTETTEKETPVEIIRGRMPLAIVALIKFAALDESDGALARKYRTTNGKVSDIRKGRNFAYITEEFKPDADMQTAAITYAEQCTDEAVLAEVKDCELASDDEAKAFLESRKGSRKKSVPAKDVDAADGADDTADEAGDTSDGSDLDDLLE